MTADPERRIPDIESERLVLRWMSPSFMQASLDGRTEAAAGELGQPLPEGWPEENLHAANG
jgi:hypothetical protein